MIAAYILFNRLKCNVKKLIYLSHKHAVYEVLITMHVGSGVDVFLQICGGLDWLLSL